MEAVKTEVVDDGSKQDRRGRKLAARERMEEVVGKYHRNGLTQAEFTRQAGMNYSTFAERFALIERSANVVFMTEKGFGKGDERVEMAPDPDARLALNAPRRAFAMVVRENLVYGRRVRTS